MLIYREQPPKATDHRTFLTLAHPEWSDSHQKRVLNSFKQSDYAACVYEEDALVGTVRVLTDHVAFGLIADLLVDPEHRHQGIASTLVKMCRVALPEYYLYADPANPGLADFYQKNGFEERPIWRCRPTDR